jgi:hypothetical protein
MKQAAIRDSLSSKKMKISSEVKTSSNRSIEKHQFNIRKLRNTIHPTEGEMIPTQNATGISDFNGPSDTYG